MRKIAPNIIFGTELKGCLLVDTLASKFLEQVNEQSAQKDI